MPGDVRNGRSALKSVEMTRDPQKLRFVLGGLAILIWPVFTLTSPGFEGFTVFGGLILAAPAIGYIFALRSRTGSLLVGMALIGTRSWFIWYLLTNDSSTAARMIFMVLILDAVSVGVGATVDYLRSPIEDGFS